MKTMVETSVAIGLMLMGAEVFSAQDDVLAEPKILPEVVIKAKRIDEQRFTSPGGIGHVTSIDVNTASTSITRLDDLLIDAGLVAGDANNSLGLSAGINARGFSILQQNSSQLSASKVFLNGHPDIAWRFARDPATVERVDVLSGQDATFLGAGSPGASINYISKAPEGNEFKRLSISLGSNNAKRLVADTEVHIGQLQVRSVLAIQRDDFSAEKVQDERNVGLVSVKLPTDWGDFRVDAEYHQLMMPYVFGTAYASKRFWLEHSYVDERANANRQYYRSGLYWQKKSDNGLTWSAYSQNIRSKRDETLIGFYDIKNETQLRGYYRTIDEQNRQTDNGLKLDGQWFTGAVQHDWSLSAQQHQQNRNFSGPQNIGGFTLDLPSPQFPVNLAKLALSDRYALETYIEKGLSLADKLTLEAWELRIGMRRSKMEFDRSTNPLKAQIKEAETSHTSAALGLGYKFSEVQRVWLSSTQSFLPNRGFLRNGDYLPPSKGQQTEAGWTYSQGKQNYSISFFDIKQSNLPAVDPLDKDASILIGTNKSKGVELNASFLGENLKWGGSLTALKARITQPVSAAQGEYLTGTPSAYGALFATVPISGGFESTARMIFAAKRPGDDAASFEAPGYTIFNLGLRSPRKDSSRWGMDINNVFDKSYVRAISARDNVWQGSRRAIRVWAELSYF